MMKEKSPAALSRCIDDLLELQKAYQMDVGDSRDERHQSVRVAKLIKLTSVDLPALREHIWNLRNRTPPRARSARKLLLKLAQRIDAAMNGVGIEREADPSAAREEELHAEFSAAKTNRGRRRAGRLIAEQNRDRELVMKQRKAATHEHAIASRKKEIYQAKKVQRIYNKLCKAAQISACVRSGADIEERISD
jgi:hypothetical protein